jgi:hypothetical protein
MRRNTRIVLNRRDWMALAGTGVFGVRLYAASAGFWNKKDPSEWTEDEVQILLTQSPWAKQATTIVEPGPRGTPSAGAGSGATGVGVNGIGLGPGGRQEKQDTGNTNAPPPFQGVVVWESAQTILDARKKPLPKEFKDHYTLSISGIPSRQIGYDKLVDQLRQFTSLQPNDQPPVQPGTVRQEPGRANALLVGFSKDVLQLSANDKSIHFTTAVGLFLLKTKFDTKEMRYQGRLAL